MTLRESFSHDIVSGTVSVSLANGVQLYARGNQNAMDFGWSTRSVSSYFKNVTNPKFYFRVTIDTGSALDPVGKEGLHHFMEHCMLATPDYPDFSSLDDELEARAGYLNAATSDREIIIDGFIHPSEKNISFVLGVLKEMLTGFHATEKTIERERNRVLTEMLECQEDPYRRLKQAMANRMAVINGRDINIFGTEESVESFTLADLEECFSQRITGKNIRAAFISPYNASWVLDQAKAAFEAISAGSKNDFGDLCIEKGVQVQLPDNSGRSSDFIIQLHAGKLKPHERFVLSVIGDLVDTYFRREIIRQGVAYHCEAKPCVMDDETFIEFSGKVRPDHLPAVSSALIKTLALFGSELRSFRYQSALDRAKNFAAGPVTPQQILEETRALGRLHTYQSMIYESYRTASPNGLLDFVRNNLLSQPPNIAVSGTEDALRAFQRLPERLQALRQELDGKILPDGPSWWERNLIGPVRGLVRQP